jgi:phage terminase large subunit-like protein
MGNLTDEQLEWLMWDWKFWARPKQLPPDGDWSTWVIRAGRGFGKTRSGTGWVHDRAMEHPGRWIAFLARTPADARDYMIDGPGGILKNTPPWERPYYEPSKRRIVWPNGSWATIYSDEEPDQTRGFSGDTAWLDEFGKFKHAQECWENLNFGMREVSGDQPRRIITTTPRPIAILKKIEGQSSTVVTVGTSHENRSNLDPTWYKDVILKYEKTRLGRQEVMAEILDDVPGALWTRAMLDEAKIEATEEKPVTLPSMQRIVVGVDPSGASGDPEDDSDSIGIVVAGKGIDGNAYILDDFTCSMSPEGWGRKTVDAYLKWSADRVVGEKNYGGDMVRFVIQTASKGRTAVSYKDVNASRGKVVRAEPVSALYEQGRVKHAGHFPELEDQMVSFTHSGFLGKGSPDRVDAAVWAITDLMLGEESVSMADFL